MDKQILREFAEEIRQKIVHNRALPPKEVMEAQTELSILIGTKTQALMAQGFDIFEIQEIIRAAMDEDQSNTETESTEEQSLREEPEEAASEDFSDAESIDSVAHLTAIDEVIILDYRGDKIDKKEFAEQLRLSEILICNSLEQIEMILTDYGKAPRMEAVTDYGEIVAGADGEAFIPEWLEFENRDGLHGAMCDPMVYKSAGEIKTAYGLIREVDDQTFRKKFNIKKLAGAMEMPKAYRAAFKQSKEEICLSLLDDYIKLKEFYQKCTAENKAVVLYYSYYAE